MYVPMNISTSQSDVDESCIVPIDVLQREKASSLLDSYYRSLQLCLLS